MFGKKKEKKKKGCLGRIFGLVWKLAILGVVVLVVDVLLEDDTDYISDQEVASGEEDISFSDLMDIFFDYYGYYPEDSDEEDYNYSDYYDNRETDNYHRERRYRNTDYNEYDNYYNRFDRNNRYSDYYNDYYDDYYDDYQNYQETKTNPSKSKVEVPEYSSSSESAKQATSDSIRRFVECAKSYMGTPYVWGGTSRSGVDCSGLIYLAAQEAGLGTLPRTAKTLHGIASKIDKSDLSNGDLVFFSSGSSISHVAIYIGNNQILHAVSEGSNTGVITSKLSQDYWKKHYYSSGRIMSNEVTSKRAQTRAQTRSRTMDNYDNYNSYDYDYDYY